MVYEEVKDFGIEGGLNLDDDIRKLAPNEYRYALNCFSGRSTSQNIGAIENEKGNTLIEFTLPVGFNFVIGAFQDIQRNSIIYFLYNTNDNHSILQYNIDSRQIEKILWQEPFLNFSISRAGRINHVAIIEDLLIWVDGINPQRKINIERAKAYTNGLGGDAYVNLDPQVLDFIKYPPIKAPTAYYSSDINRTENYVRAKNFQFIYRYIYDDDEKSVWSPISKVIYEPYDFRFKNQAVNPDTGNFPLEYLNPYMNNGIIINLILGHHTVKYIEVAFREAGDEGLFYIVERLDQDEIISTGYGYGATYSEYVFYNEKFGKEVAIEEVTKSQDFVPRQSKCMDLITGNRIVFANNLEGFTLPDIDIEPSVIMNKISNYTQATKPTIPHQYYTSPFNETGMNLPQLSNLAVGDEIIFEDIINGGQYKYYVISSDLENYPNNLATSMFEALLRQGLISFPNPGNPPYNTRGYDYYFWTEVEITHKEIKTEIFPAFKTGAQHKFAIAYYDRANRKTSAIKTDPLDVYIPSIMEHDPGGSDSYYAHVQLNIKHKPPEYATHYQILYAGNVEIQDCLQTLISGRTDTGSGGGARTTKLDIEPFAQWKILHPLSTKSFVPEPGDYVREVRAPIALNTKSTPQIIDRYSETYEVLAFDAGTNQIEISFAGQNAPFRIGSLVEVIKRRQELSNEIFYEIGEEYEIGNSGLANRYHKGKQSDQDPLNLSGSPAVILLEKGDVYVRHRYYGTTGTVPTDLYYEKYVEDFEWSDFYSSGVKDQGRANAVIEDFQEKRFPTLIRFGGQYFENSNFNQMNEFNSGDSRTLAQKYGPINKLVQVGYTLKALQDRKNTSIYINRTSSFNPDGTEDIVLTDRVVGTVRPSNDDYGCILPESVFKHDRHIYFFDAYNGKLIRDAANGMQAISSNKAFSFFRDKAKIITENLSNLDLIYCQGGFNEEADSYIFSFQQYVEGPVSILLNKSDTISFNETSNRWKSFHSYAPDCFENVGLTLVSFKNGELYVHNDNDQRCSFYGVKYPNIVRIISAGPDPKGVFDYDTLAVDSNKVWEAPDILIPPNDQYPEGMKTRLKSNKFKALEGKYYAAFMRDLNTPGMQSESEVYRLVNGRSIRGKMMTIELENMYDEEVVLFNIMINPEYSQISA